MRTSFLIPVYNTDVDVLRLCINSVLKAACGQHEVIVIDDSSTSLKVQDLIARCKCREIENLRILQNAENSGVCYSLNKAADNATGELIAPVDHDDMVIALGFWQMLRYQDYYGVCWAYSNEQQITYKGMPIANLFKPAYSPQLLRSTMYINHLQLIPMDLFKSIGGYQEGFEGSQDHDLALRLSEYIEPVHVDTMAYLWRRNGDTFSVQKEKTNNLCIERSQRALEEHFKRLGLQATVDAFVLKPTPTLPLQPTGTFISRIQPRSHHKLSIVIPCKLGTKVTIHGKMTAVLEHCLQSIQRSLTESNQQTSESPDVEILLVLNDGDNIQQARKLLTEFGFVGSCFSDVAGFSFARKCNLAASKASGDILIFLNDDTDIQTAGWTSHVISLLQEDDVACVGGMLLNIDRTVQSCGDNVGRNSAVHYVPNPIPSSVGDMMHRYIADHETTSITGAFLCIRKAIFEKLNGFSTAFPNSFQDVDLCLRARRLGMRCIVSPHVKLLHFESISRNPTVESDTIKAIRQLHYGYIAAYDPYSMYRYEKASPPLFTVTGIRYFLASIKRRLVRLAYRTRFLLMPGIRLESSVLKKSEWQID